MGLTFSVGVSVNGCFFLVPSNWLATVRWDKFQVTHNPSVDITENEWVQKGHVVSFQLKNNMSVNGADHLTPVSVAYNLVLTVKDVEFVGRS